MKRFENKVIVVTGAGDGIGLGIARQFAAEGGTVVIAEINQVSGKRAEEQICLQGGKALFIQTDVSDEKNVENLVKTTVDRLGKIDVLVNNAGVVVHKRIVDTEKEAWDRQIAVQLTGPFLTCKHVARHMIARGGYGKIVNISSVSAVMGRVKGGAHCVSKAGLTLLTKVMAMEMGEYKVNVNAVAPGLIDVPSQRDEANISTEYKQNYLRQLPISRMGEVDDIASMVLFLSSAEADWITGQLFLVDGGLMAGHMSLQGTHDFTMLQGHQ